MPKGSKTRQRLIDSTLEIVRTEGPAGLTTGKIANAAGIQQPGFYAHFKNVDACLKAAADQLAERMRQAALAMRRQSGFGMTGREELPHSG